MLEKASNNVRLQLFSDILLNTRDCIIILDEQFEICYWNQKLCNIPGLDSRAVGKPIFSIFDWPELPAVLFNSELGYHETVKRVISKKKEIKILRVLIHSFIHSLTQTRYIVINLSDISEIIATELKEGRASLAKSEFLANLSHEIRTPLVGILGFCEMLSKAKLQTEEIEYLETIEFCALQLMGIVNKVLDLSKMETEEIKIKQKPFNLREMVGKTINTLKPDMEKKGLICRENIAQDIPAILLGDEVKVQQVLANLITNAIKYTETGYIEISLAVDEDKPPAPGYIAVKLSVQDTGSGIPPKQVKQIFEPFIQVNKTEEYNGLGLGLAISKRLVNSMGGEIWYEANGDQGSIFFFSLSLATQDIIIQEEASSYTLPIEKTKNKVMLVEDIAINRKLISLMLKNMGYQVIEAANGQECLDKLNESDPDIIIMDMQMPILDGYEASRQIKKQAQFKHIHIIALTAYAMTSDINKCLEAGCDHYLSKPFTQAQLAEVLDTSSISSG